MTATVDGAAQEARALAHAVRDRLPHGRPGVVAVATASGGLVLTVNAAARSPGRNAAEMVKELLGGRGGGSPETAQGGGLAAAELAVILADLLPRLVAEGAIA
ncbi:MULTISPECIES: DHHA1 domain-containing protein [unclassified Streptomyces]|uniref:DHHA1 domain-containing protein n=1 Tax=unclassified Streptomyces TaxID=2593676 RepID=UPI0029B9CE4F|nr:MULTISPECIES: DHHA1 domain-containing protein [unclassified Streptomyces]MDX3300453.1 DHHA1 domain-containing protein [Streptomyces sp. ME02-7008A]